MTYKDLLGGKGATLAEMTSVLELPVPPGFTVTTEVCTYFYDNKRKYPTVLQSQMEKGIANMEKIMGYKFGDSKGFPLLLAVRSGARDSMPGMMDTVLNLGLNDATVEALSKATGRQHAHLAEGAHHTKRRFHDLVAQPRKIISAPTWSGIESEEVSYNAGWTSVHELIPWRTLTGRQQFYQDHPWMRAFGEGLSTYRPPVDTKTLAGVHKAKSNGNPEVVLNWITPHQKWGIHSTYSDNLIMLTLSRGGPCIWISEIDAKEAGIEDNDWIEVFNLNGAVVARAVVSQRVRPGMTMMYHAQERVVNTPGSEITGNRGGIHNSVTRAVVKPTHMIGGYAQQAYGFNYYGTVGSNRDEMVIVRKMAKVDWLDGDDESILAQRYIR